MPNLTVNVAPELLRQAKVYASQNSTTLSDIVRRNLVDLTRTNRSTAERYADGSISSAEGQRELGLDSKDQFFEEVCGSGHSLYHLDRAKADQLATEALVITGAR
ncbi:MAG: hypothetical protein ACKO1K_09525 [Burkholderiales bacterium]